jgi:hypothetical protein
MGATVCARRYAPGAPNQHPGPHQGTHTLLQKEGVALGARDQEGLERCQTGVVPQQGELEGRELRLPPDEARQASGHRGLETPTDGGRPDKFEDFDRCRQPLDWHRSQRLHLDEALGELERLRRQENAPGRGELFHAGRQVRGLADGGVVHMEIVPDRPHHDLPAVEAHAHLHRDPVRVTHLLAVAAHGVLHRQSRVAGPHRMILMGDWGPEQGHDAIAHDLVHGPLVAMHRRHHAFEYRVENLAGLLGVTIRQQLQRALQVRKENRDLLALAFQGCTGHEDLLGEIGGRIGKRQPGLVWGWRGTWGWRRGWGARPYQTAADVLDHLRVGVEEFILQGCQVVVVELELELECAIGYPPAALQHGKGLVEDLLEGHGR